MEAKMLHLMLLADSAIAVLHFYGDDPSDLNLPQQLSYHIYALEQALSITITTVFELHQTLAQSSSNARCS